MKSLIAKQVEKFLHERKNYKRWLAAVFCLAVLVSLGTVMILRHTGTAMTGDLQCGMEEHTHTEECWQANAICGQEEAEGHSHTEECYGEGGELVCGQEEAEGHSHTEECYERQLICELEEHVHTDDCYKKKEAGAEGGEASSEEGAPSEEGNPSKEETPDGEEEAVPKETAEIWEATLPDKSQLKGTWAENLVAVAKSQLGYQESSEDVLEEDGEEPKGFSRYGAWYGDEYGDWNAMFVSFCLHYAGIPQEAVSRESDCGKWEAQLGEMELYQAAGEYLPEAGDLVFFRNAEGAAVRVGIVEKAEVTGSKEDGSPETVAFDTIEGDVEAAVAEGSYGNQDSSICGYLSMKEAVKRYIANYPAEAEALGLKLEEPEEEPQEQKTDPAEDVPEGNTPSGEERQDSPENGSGEYAMSQSAETENYIVTVSYNPDANLPEAAELRVVEYGRDSEEFQEYSEKLGYEPKWLLNIGFFVGDEKVEPESGVSVKVVMKNQEEVKDYHIVHFLEDGTTEREELTGVGAKDEAGVSTEFVTESFSMYAAGEGNVVEYTMNVGDTQLLRTDAFGQPVSEGGWSTSDENIASLKIDVSDNVVVNVTVIANSPGEAVITARPYAGTDFMAVTYIIHVVPGSSTDPDDPEVPTAPELEHHKYIKYDAQTDRYDLALDVAGRVETTTTEPMYDILFVVDNSQTMTGADSSAVKQEITKLMSELGSRALDVRYNLVEYGEQATGIGWGNSEKIIQNLNNLSPHGKTNFEAAFVAASGALQSVRPGAARIMIFLTDGEPNTSSSHPNMSDFNVQVYEDTIAAARKIQCDYFCAVGFKEGSIGSGEYTMNRRDLLKWIAEAVQASARDTQAGSISLGGYIDSITGTTNTFTCTNVNITDQLSQYIEATTDSTLEIIVRDDTGESNVVASSEKLAASSTGVSAIWQDADKMIATATFDVASKSATLIFREDYELEADYTYTLNITNLVATQSAYQEFIQEGYPNTGDAKTDYEDHHKGSGIQKTSSEKFGFPSNTSATLTYNYNDTPVEPATYPVPVIQVYPGKLVIQKTVNGLDNEQLETLRENLQFELKVEKPGNGNEETYTIPFSRFDEEGKFSGHVTNESNQTIDLSKLEPETKYTITENNPEIDGMVCSPGSGFEAYKADENAVFQGAPPVGDGTIKKNEMEIYTLTNKYTEASQELEGIQIKKYSQQNSTTFLPGAEFTFCKLDKDGKPIGETVEKLESTDKNGIAQLPSLEVGGNYQLTETKAPEGYNLLEEPIVITVKNNNGTIEIKVQSGAGATIGEDGKTILISNSTGIVLPSTGGSGTLLYTLGGLAILATSLMYGFSMKRRQERGYK